MAVYNVVRKRLALSIFAVLAVGHPAFAQQAPTTNGTTPATDAPKKVTTLSGMIVTAQKREQAMQTVPITMTVATKQLLQDADVRDVKALQILVPSMYVYSTGSEALTSIRLRGIGTVGDNPGLESSVGTVIDGVPRARTGAAFDDLGELERIEVLYGPQGTLFGQNTSAGVVNIVTAAPSFHAHGDTELTVGNYGALDLGAYYTAPISDKAAFSIYASNRTRDGFYDVETGPGPRTENSDSNQDVHSLRGKLLLLPTKNVDITIIGDYSTRDEHCCTAVATVRGPTANILDALVGGSAVSANPADPYAYVAYSNRDDREQIIDDGVSAEINWTTPWLNNATFTSITSKREWTADEGGDLEFTTADIFDRPFGQPGDSSVTINPLTEELRLAGNTDKFDWTVGYFLDNEDLVRHDLINMGSDYEAYMSSLLVYGFKPYGMNTANPATFISQATGLPYGTSLSGVGMADMYKQTANSNAVFGNVTFHATDALDLTAGLRYTDESKQLDSTYTNPNGDAGCAAMLADPARVYEALVARGVPGAIAKKLIPTVIGDTCLAWSDALDARTTHQSLNEKEWSGTLKGVYTFNDNVMTYLTGSRGYKAGGFNMDRVQSATGLNDQSVGILPVNNTSFVGEFVNSYELGTKTTWLDGSLLANAALFDEQFTNYQLNEFVGTGYDVLSLPKATSKGVDTNVMWQATKNWLLQAGVTYNDVRVGKDIPGAAFAPGGVFGLLPGARMPLASLWSDTASVTYEHPLTDTLLGRFNISAKYESGVNQGATYAPELYQGGYTVVNARVGITPNDKQWSVELWSDNLTGARYAQVRFAGVIQTGTWDAFLGAPRTWGATFRYNFR
jgi:outer membrane receptor protein involved in Fe transport